MKHQASSAQHVVDCQPHSICSTKGMLIMRGEHVERSLRLQASTPPHWRCSRRSHIWGCVNANVLSVADSQRCTTQGESISPPRLQSHGNQSRCHTRWHTGEQRRSSKKAQMGVGVDRNGCAKRGNWRLHSKNTKTRILHYQAL